MPDLQVTEAWIEYATPELTLAPLDVSEVWVEFATREVVCLDGQHALDLWNVAAIELGVQQVSDLNENTATARTMRSSWPIHRRSFLAMHPWNGALRRAELVQLPDDPIGEWKYAYAIPADYLRATDVNHYKVVEREDDKWEIALDDSGRQKVLLTNATKVTLGYIADVDVCLLGPMAAEALAYYFAAALAGSFGKKQQVKDRIKAKADEAYKKAKRADSKSRGGRKLQPPSDMTSVFY